MECETKCEDPLTLPEALIQAGCRITWQGADGEDRSGVVDFLHTDADGTLWAFCICPGGTWAAVNRNYLTTSDGAEKADER
jgi:hypothetical protein